MTEWRQERPAWCPHQDCIFQRRAMDALCGGTLPSPEMHGETPNTDRFCVAEDGAVLLSLQVNANDLDWFRWIFDALDGKQTSWLSRRTIEGGTA